MGDITCIKDIKDEPEKTSEPASFFKINKKTLPLKVILFFFSGAMAAILPYLTIHMQEIGITIQETAIIYAVLPFTSFMGPPLTGMLADKFGNYKPVLILATIVNSVFHTSLLWVPIYKETPLTSSVLFQFSFSSDKALIFPLELTDCNTFIGAFSEFTTLETQISSCTSLSEFNEVIDNSCRIDSISTEISQINCTPNSSATYEGSIARKLDLSLIKEEINNCSVRVGIPTRTFIGEREITCNTDLTFFSGEMLIEGSNAVTFWTYFLLRILATVFMGSCFSLLDATTLAIVKKMGDAEYGKERIWSVVGFGVFSPIAGLLVDQISRSKGYTDYSAAFYVSNVLVVFTIVVLCLMNLEVEKLEKGLMKNVQKLFRYPEVVVFLIMIFCLGTMWGFVESYLFIFLKELEAPNYLLGLTLSVGAVAGIPFSYGSEKIFNRFGRVNIIILAFLTYFVRFFGYSYITSPFWCFPFEAMEAFTFHTMWIAAATYCSELAPKGLLATLMGVMGSLHYGLGKGNGAFIGGYMIGAINTRLSFRYLGVSAGIFGIFFFFLHYFWLDKVVHCRLAKEIVNTNGSTTDTYKIDTDKAEELGTVENGKDDQNLDDAEVTDEEEEAMKIMLPKVISS